jgi:hypothetical protein
MNLRMGDHPLFGHRYDIELTRRERVVVVQSSGRCEVSVRGGGSDAPRPWCLTGP